jgi:hypothetical protein
MVVVELSEFEPSYLNAVAPTVKFMKESFPRFREKKSQNSRGTIYLFCIVKKLNVDVMFVKFTVRAFPGSQPVCVRVCVRGFVCMRGIVM